MTTLSVQSTCIANLIMFVIPFQSFGFHTRLLEFLFEQDLQITRYTYQVAARNSHAQLAFFAGIRYENFISPLLDDSELLEAVFMKSGHQLRGLLHQPRLLHALDTQTLTDALITSTITDWVDGCRVLLDANIISYLGDPSSATRYRGRSLLSISALFNRLDMLQFWLAQREECDEQQLNLIGYIEDALSLAQGPRSGIPIMDVIQLLLSHLIKQRHEVKLLMEKHGLEHCCERARTSLADAHLSCMLTTLVTERVGMPRRYWPRRRSLYYMPEMWRLDKLKLFESFERAGLCDISQQDFKCNKDIACSPLVYSAVQKMQGVKSGSLSERNMTVQWFLSRGANLRDTWPGTNTTAVHCLAWQSAECLRTKVDSPSYDDFPIMEESWTYEDYEFLVKEEILDQCECGCSRIGCDFLSCFWKEIFAAGWYCPPFPLLCDRFKNKISARDLGNIMLYAPGVVEKRHDLFMGAFLDLTLWVEKAANTLELSRLIHG